MHIQQLQLTQFRNYLELSLQFAPGINCITGPNGSGKTNILDALHYLAFTKGFRSNQDKQAVQKGADFFFTEATLLKRGEAIHLQCNFVTNKGKKMLRNRSPLQKMSDHIGEVPLVAVLPNDPELINGPSALRRRFLDMLISQYDPQYLQSLIQYERILSQRNALLRLFGEQGGFDEDQLELWDGQLIPLGIYLHDQRKQFLEEFAPAFEHYFKRIVSDSERPRIKYRSAVESNTPEGWQDMLQAQREKDRVLQYTTRGIHRDDLTFHINDRSVRHFGSQGQQKTFVISLKLAQYRLLEAHTALPPILLLDDIFDKLDETRLKQIAHMLDQEIDGQIFITDTSAERLGAIFDGTAREQLAFFAVRQGEAKAMD